MTMQSTSHPDDELLAAYAGGDRDAVADPSLSAHVAACDLCAPMVDELAALRTALAELPDLVPSRPLRLLPPVPAAAAPRSAPLAWLRRLAGPAMAVGVGLILIGAIGVGAPGGLGSFFGQAARTVFQNVGDNLQGAGAPEGEATGSDNALVPGAYNSSSPPGATKGVTDSGRSMAETSPSPAPVDAGPTEHLDGGSSQAQPWLTLLIAGVALLGTAAVLRFSISPGAG